MGRRGREEGEGRGRGKEEGEGGRREEEGREGGKGVVAPGTFTDCTLQNLECLH